MSSCTFFFDSLGLTCSGLEFKHFKLFHLPEILHAGKGRGRGGGQGKGGRGGGGGRNVRGVDFGLGIGYSADAANTTPSAPQEKAPKVQYQREEVQMRGSVVDSLKLGMMARFKNSFVAANTANPVGYTAPQASTPQGRVYGAPPSVNGRGRGNFVSAGSFSLYMFLPFFVFMVMVLEG